jgi:hypothetical protein
MAGGLRDACTAAPIDGASAARWASALHSESIAAACVSDGRGLHLPQAAVVRGQLPQALCADWAQRL